MNNQNVVKNWLQGKRGKSQNMDTDGLSLFSYNMKIGQTLTKEKEHDLKIKQVLDVTAPNFYSQTTSTHVNLAKMEGAKRVQGMPNLKKHLRALTNDRTAIIKIDKDKFAILSVETPKKVKYDLSTKKNKEWFVFPS